MPEIHGRESASARGAEGEGKWEEGTTRWRSLKPPSRLRPPRKPLIRSASRKGGSRAMDGEEESVGGQKIESIEGSHRSIPSGHISPRDKGHFVLPPTRKMQNKLKSMK
jgi:hypothetical protein